MASPQASERIGSKAAITFWDFDVDASSTAKVATPDGTNLNYIDGKNFSHFGFLVQPTVASSDLITVEIVASSDTAFTSPVQIKTAHATDIAADSPLVDEVWLECTAEEIAQEAADAGSDLRYVSVRIKTTNAGDEAIICAMAWSKHLSTGLTATTIS